MDAARPHALYRFFDPNGALLYVGITNNPSRRFTQHGVDREWWLEVETIRMERHPDREAVLAAEREAIKAERPKYNIVHAAGPVTNELPGAVRLPPAGDYPVAAGECVALGLTPRPNGDQRCPVGVVIEVSRFGVKLALLRWHLGYFDGGERMIPWHQIMDILWAREMDPYEIEKDGYARPSEGDPPMFDTAPLADFQTRWTKGDEYMRSDEYRALYR